MAAIITLTSGLAQVGKSHLGMNIALELTRKGHGVGYYHELGGQCSLNRLLQLHQRSGPEASDRKTSVTCLGYQGVDILGSNIPLAYWNTLKEDEIASLVSAHEAWSGYDDFLIDTSGMSPRALIACCRLSDLVLLVVTSDRRSQAEAFALLRVLRLNACDGPVRLIVNKVKDAAQAESIHALFAEKARQYLGLEVPLLAAVIRDEHVQFAARRREAFTSIFPESMASGCVVKLVEQLLDVRLAPRVPSGLPGLWKDLAASMRLSFRLPGDATLADYERVGKPTQDAVTAAGVDEHREHATLLRFEGPLARLGNVMEKFSGVIHILADDIQAFHDRLDDLHSDASQRAEWSEPDAGVLEITLAAILDSLRRGVSRQQQVTFQVQEDPVDGQEADWLAAGYYIRYVFVLSPGQNGLAETLRQDMERIPGLRLSKGPEGECICEAISKARDACLGVIHTPQGEIRISYWHRPDRRKSLRMREPISEVSPYFSPGSRMLVQDSRVRAPRRSESDSGGDHLSEEQAQVRENKPGPG
jgi:flagellar biosynthesis protein FlhG